MPGGMTQHEAEQALAELAALYGVADEPPSNVLAARRAPAGPQIGNALASRRQQFADPTPERRAFLAPLVTPRGSDTPELGVPGILYQPYEAARTLLSPEGQYQPGGDDYDRAARLGLQAAGGAATGTVFKNALFGAPVSGVGVFGGRIGTENLAKAGRPTAMRALDMAEELERAGATQRQIREATNAFIAEHDPEIGGVHKGADGQWRFEIDDSASRYSGTGPSRSLLGNEFEHPTLFAAYPDLRDVALKRPKSFQGADYRGSITPEEMRFGPDANDKTSVLHEVQHALAKREGFARGGSIEGELARLKEDASKVSQVSQQAQESRQRAEARLEVQRQSNPDFIGSAEERRLLAYIKSIEDELWDQEAVTRYGLLAGETEARNVESRADMLPGERRRSLPFRTQDVPNYMQNVRRW